MNGIIPIEHETNCCSAANNSLLLSSSGPDIPNLTVSGKIRAFITIFLFFISMLLNGSFLLKLQKTKKGNKRTTCHTRMQVLLKNLMLANLLETLLIMPLDAVWNLTVQWHAGDLLCRILSFLKLFSMYAVAFIVVVISLDRCLAITMPLTRKRQLNLGKHMLASVWLISIIFAAPQLFIFRVIAIENRLDGSFSQCSTHGSFSAWWQLTLYNLFTFSCLFILPLLLMLICNTIIIRTMTHGTKKLQLNCTRNVMPQARLKTLKMTVAFATLYIICWTPYYVIGIWYWFEPEMISKVSDPVNHFFYLFGLLNPCLDPVIYRYFSM
ncbi:gonadotropin-releasing hormone receptor isoform X2 [Engystomops pustulosus]|uniref:gonadotropin-releasing hormone receptor isoform X2 n=1 Tax=Engystomops pustulosus TaxID=76066 RepID=UPI003AFB58E6